MVQCGVVCVRHGVVQCGVMRLGVVWCGEMQCGVIWCDELVGDVVRYGVVKCVVQCGVCVFEMWCSEVWCNEIWCGVVW